MRKINIPFIIFIGIFVVLTNYFLIPLIPNSFDKFHVDIIMSILSGILGAYIGFCISPVNRCK